MNELMNEPTETLVFLLWLSCKGKIELIEAYFDKAFENVKNMELETKNNEK